MHAIHSRLLFTNEPFLHTDPHGCMYNDSTVQCSEFYIEYSCTTLYNLGLWITHDGTCISLNLHKLKH